MTFGPLTLWEWAEEVLFQIDKEDEETDQGHTCVGQIYMVYGFVVSAKNY